jgi:hypothetical protein
MWYTTLIKHLIRKKHYTLCQLVRNLLLTQINLWCHLSLGKASLGQPVIVKQAFLHICDHQDAEKLLKRLQGHVWKITHLTPVLDRWVRWKAETLLYLAQPAQLLHKLVSSASTTSVQLSSSERMNNPPQSHSSSNGDQERPAATLWKIMAPEICSTIQKQSCELDKVYKVLH